jgi:hypothetical protein
MKLPTLLALGAALLVAAGGSATAQPPVVKDGYVKVRVEVETRGVLKVTDKEAAVLTRYRYYDQRDDKKENPTAEGIPPHRIELDFTRHPELRELAKALDGKEVVLTGLSELRHVAPPPLPPGGFTGGMPPAGFGFYHAMPSWVLQPTVLVTGLKSVPGKR